MKNPHDIILRPVLTEKGYDGIADKRYVFEVAISAKSSRRWKPSLKASRWKRSTPCAPSAR